MNRRNFFRIAAQFVLGCALAVRVKPLLATVTEDAVVYDERALMGRWIYMMTPSIPFPHNMGRTIEPNWGPNPDWVDAKPEDAIVVYWESKP